MSAALDAHPRLPAGSRLQFDDVRDEHLLLIPEGVVKLNATAVEVLELCDGDRTVAAVVETLTSRYPGAELADDVCGLLGEFAAQGLILL